MLITSYCCKDRRL